MWLGYVEFGGNEIINAQRTAEYASHLSWFRDVYRTDAIGIANGESYSTPLADPAPWWDPEEPDSLGFYGAYPLNVTGLDDSTREAAVTENIGDGGAIGPIRNRTRSGVFEVALIGEAGCNVEYGMRWLRSALMGGVCDTGCEGQNLCYFNCEPCFTPDCISDPELVQECRDDHIRTLRGTKCISGPTVTRKRTTSNGGAVWTVTFTTVSGNPFEFGKVEDLIEGFMSGSDPWVPDDIPSDWLYDDTGEVFEETDCAEPEYQPLVDPLCPAIIVPPAPPSINPNCFTPLDTWTRRWFTLPAEYVPYWGDVVPTIRVQAGPQEVRPLRLRFYLDPDANGTGQQNPCSYCADIVVSFLPPNHTLVIDGADQIAYADGPGGSRRRADHLLFKTDGTPFNWPAMSCGVGYVVTVDTDPSAPDLPEIDVSLTPKVYG